MKIEVSTPSSLSQRVKRALIICRETKLAFPNVLMGVTGEQSGNDGAIARLADDPLFRDGNGEMNWCALCAMADGALGAASDMKTGPQLRPATAHIELQTTGASTKGNLSVESYFVGFSETSKVKQSLLRMFIKAGDTLIAHASAASVLFNLPPEQARAKWPWLPEGFKPSSAESSPLEPNELAALANCAKAEEMATGEHPFIEHFWSGIPSFEEGSAQQLINVTPALGNRIGHVQGGLLLGSAIRVANAAAPQNMRLSNISAYFLSPGLGPELKIYSKIIHQGKKLALVQTRMLNSAEKLVLEATSQHVLA